MGRAGLVGRLEGRVNEGRGGLVGRLEGEGQ